MLAGILAIYVGSRGRYVLRPYGGGEALWAILGPDYTREAGQKLADSLNEEREGRRSRDGEAPPDPAP